jgi:uncharacterized protein
MKNVTVTAINVFLIRSCAGVSLQEATVTPHGLSLDRHWRLVTSAGKFLTQRECPQMALLQPSLLNSALRLSFAGKAEIAPCGVDSSTHAPIRINETCQGIDQGDDVAQWLFTVLGTDARLLRVVDDAASTDFLRPDMSPVLVISEESLADLNSRLDEPVLMNRFRPNIVVRGLKPYEEDSWERVLIGDVVYVASTEPCGRCTLITVDQEKGEKSGKEPLKTLATYRRVPGAVIFGKYMVPESVGLLRVNDTITTAAI